MRSSVLIVDDEAGVRSALSGVLRDEGYAVEAVDSGEACLDRVMRATFDVIVLDIWLPGMDGLATLEKLQDRRIVAEHGGSIEVGDNIPQGSRFVIELPC